MATKYFILDHVSLHFDFIKYQCRPVLLQQTRVSAPYNGVRQRQTNCFFFLIGGRMSVFGRDGGPRASREKFSTQKNILMQDIPMCY